MFDRPEFNTRPTREPQPGDSLGKYKLLTRLDSGGMGDVWKAQAGGTGRLVAIKLLPIEARDSRAAFAEVEETFQLVEGLTHQSICKALELEQDPVFGPYLVLDFVRGMRLDDYARQWRREGKSIGVAEVVAWLEPIAEALDYAHQHEVHRPGGRIDKGVLHRDVKPANIMLKLDSAGQVTGSVLIDYGLAATIRQTISRHTRQTVDLSGTLPYMAPEQVRGLPLGWNARTDQYALAVVAYELLAGSLPLWSEDPQALREAIKTEVPSAIAEFPAGVNAMLARGLAKLPLDRYGSCGELLRELQRVVPRPPEPSPGIGRWLAIAAVCGLLVFLAGWKGNGSRPPASPPAPAATNPAASRRESNRAEGMPTAAGMATETAVPASAPKATVTDTTSARKTTEVQPASTAGGNRPSTQSVTSRKSVPALLQAPFSPAKTKQAQQEWAGYLGVFVEEKDQWGQELVLVPPGEFTMGSMAEHAAAVREYNPQYKEEWLAWEQPARRVRITTAKQYGKFPVTVGQFGAFVKATGYQTEAESSGQGSYVWNGKEWKLDAAQNWRQPGFEQDAAHPVVCVSYNDSRKYVEWLNSQGGEWEYRLLTEAEWEYAARGGTTTWHSGGDDVEGLARIGNVADVTAAKVFPNWEHIASEDGYVYTSPVGRFEPNGFGLYDMLGNVRTWCGDWFGESYYKQGPMEDPQGPESGAGRVIRGASWSGDPSFARCALRFRDSPGLRFNSLGLRLLRVRR
jgi:sulfatase modifying factor 1